MPYQKRTRDRYVTPRLTLPQAEAVLRAVNAILASARGGDTPDVDYPLLERAAVELGRATAE